MDLQGIATLGRGGDTMLGHLTPGEIVIPKPLADDPVFKRKLFQEFMKNDMNLNTYIVGNDANQINPTTGIGEYKTIFERFGGFIQRNAPEIGATIGFIFGGPAGSAAGGAVGEVVKRGKKVQIGDVARSAAKAYLATSAIQGVGIQGGGGFSTNPFANFGKATSAAASGMAPGSPGSYVQNFVARGAQMMGANPIGDVPTFTASMNALRVNPLQYAGLGALGLTALSDIGGGGSGGSAPQFIDSPQLGDYMSRGLTTRDQLINNPVMSPVPGFTQMPDGSLVPILDDDEEQLAMPFPTFNVLPVKDGGIIDLRNVGGDISDPEGSGDEDTVNAILADGEFVLTKQAVAGVGDGDHDKGIKKLYDFMNKNENKAKSMGIGRA